MWLPTPCSGPGLSPVEWGLCVASGSGNTAQVYSSARDLPSRFARHDTCSDSSRVCYFSLWLPPCTHQPATPATQKGLSSPPPQVVSKGKTSPRVFTCPFHLPMMNDFLPATVDSVAQSSKRLHPPVPALRLNLGDSQGTHPEHLDHQDRTQKGKWFLFMSPCQDALPPAPFSLG